jgi:hypothetical protein
LKEYPPNLSLVKVGNPLAHRNPVNGFHLRIVVHMIYDKSIRKALPDHLDYIVRDRVERGHGLCVGLKCPLRNNQIGKLRGNIDV